ncbi:tetratricopeptide repeat protein [Plastoroseomonas arctica]|uniref:Tetratricopeptide repeat protein n=1 Tax=Plastoroseomonas arctica TaxID=1509237 RepID=A0AAF1KN42_9PROT|nr:tetratricopeptide repeat protein [Plastoroseomonas arctica]MBR0654118.1 tetratricopeptide repeat protein [Plastoroseomonas arctica]
MTASARGPNAEVEAALREGLAHLRAGRLEEAETQFRAAAAADPDNAPAHATLGTIIAARGRTAEAEPHLRTALRLQPNDPDALGNLGNALRQLCRMDEAEASLRSALRLRPAYPSALANLALVLRDTGRVPEAEVCLRQALHLQPDFATARADLGALLLAAGRLAEAEPELRQATRLQPQDPIAWLGLATVLRKLGRLAEAEAPLREALRLAPMDDAARIECGNLLYELGQPDAARNAYLAALEVAPMAEAALVGLGVVETQRGAHDAAEAALRAALLRRPAMPEALVALGDTLRNAGRLDEAETALRQALRLRPGDADAEVNLAFTLLQAGRHEEGWAAHEARFGAHAWRGRVRRFDVPRWDGGPLEGRRLLIHAEQGLGDTIQFCRYLASLPSAAAIGLQVQPPLVSLLRGQFAGVALVAEGADMRGFDLECPLLSLPHRLGGDATRDAYLRADEARVARWRDWLRPLPGLRVGLVWAGSPGLGADRRRSMPLASLLPLAAIDGVSLVSLQLGAAALDAPVAGIADPTAALVDFAETAGLVAALDLVIGVDTAVIHLAGALGQPAWLLNRADTCWRWGAAPDAARLYPSLREFRQPHPGAWSAVLEAVERALRTHVACMKT